MQIGVCDHVAPLNTTRAQAERYTTAKRIYQMFWFEQITHNAFGVIRPEETFLS